MSFEVEMLSYLLLNVSIPIVPRGFLPANCFIMFFSVFDMVQPIEIIIWRGF